MAEAKTKLTAASVDDFLDRIENDQVRDDCRTIAGIMPLSDVHLPMLTTLVESSVGYARKSQPS